MQECSAWQRNILQEGDAACSLAAPVTSSQSQEPTEEEHQPFPASTHSTPQLSSAWLHHSRTAGAVRGQLGVVLCCHLTPKRLQCSADAHVWVLFGVFLSTHSRLWQCYLWDPGSRSKASTAGSCPVLSAGPSWPQELSQRVPEKGAALLSPCTLSQADYSEGKKVATSGP